MGKPKDSVTYGFTLDKTEREALLKKCRDHYDMNAADFMRVVVRAIIEDRIAITKPNNKMGIYDGN